jgi:hypothetical protein
MSTYLAMWEKIHELTPEGRKRWINVVKPATGMVIDFRGVHVLDVDLLDALKNAK